VASLWLARGIGGTLNNDDSSVEADEGDYWATVLSPNYQHISPPRTVELFDFSQNPVLLEFAQSIEVDPVPVVLDPFSTRYSDLDRRVKALLERQVRVDERNAMFYPRLDLLTEMTPSETVSPTGVLARSMHAVVLAIDNKRVLKYQTDCDDDVVHPLLRESWTLNILEHTGIVPRVFFVSPAVSVPYDYTQKTAFLLTADQRRRCVVDGGLVRFMVSERIGLSLHDIREVLPYKVFSVKTAIGYTLSLVNVLRRLHDEFDIVHGDIHLGNVMLKNEHEVQLIDFGRSSFGVELDNGIHFVKDYHPHCLLGIHETIGFHHSFRDDLFRALISLALMMHGNFWMEYCGGLNMVPDSVLNFKRREFIFRIPSSPDILLAAANFNLAIHARMRQELHRALQAARKVQKTTDRPPYEIVISALTAVYSLL
jgi:hypothetical protein